MDNSKRIRTGLALLLIMISLIMNTFVDEISFDPNQVLVSGRTPFGIPEKFNYTRELEGSINTPTESFAYVDEHSSGKLEIGGKVDIQEFGLAPNPSPYYIELSAHINGLDCTIIPNSFFENDTTPHVFKVYVEVPKYTSCSESFKLTVTGITGYVGGIKTYPLEPDETIIKVKQYFIIDAEPREHNITIKESQTEKIDFTLKNNGNGPDFIRIKVQGESSDEGIRFSWVEKTIFLDENEKQSLSIYIYAKKDPYSSRPLREEIHILSNASFNETGSEKIGEIYINIYLQESDGILKWKYSWIFVIILTIVLVTILAIVIQFQKRHARRRNKSSSIQKISKIALSSFILSLGLIMMYIIYFSTTNRGLEGDLSRILVGELVIGGLVMGVLCIILGMAGIDVTRTKSQEYKGIGYAISGALIGIIDIALILYCKF